MTVVFHRTERRELITVLMYRRPSRRKTRQPINRRKKWAPMQVTDERARAIEKATKKAHLSRVVCMETSVAGETCGPAATVLPLSDGKTRAEEREQEQPKRTTSRRKGKRSRTGEQFRSDGTKRGKRRCWTCGTVMYKPMRKHASKHNLQTDRHAAAFTLQLACHYSLINKENGEKKPAIEEHSRRHSDGANDKKQ